MRSKAYLKMRERLVSAARREKKPIIGHFELTARCNLDCKMCYVHTQDNAVAQKKELSTEQWKQIFDEAYDCGMMYANLSGGECLVRKDFKELYLHLWNKRVMITVLSNGVLLNDEYVEFFKTYPPDSIQISLYGTSEERYLAVTGHKGFEKAFAAVTALESAGIDVRVVSTPSKYMIDDYIAIIKTCKERGFYTAKTPLNLIPKRDDPENAEHYMTDEDLVSLNIRLESLTRELIPMEETPETGGPMVETRPDGLDCNAGSVSALITYDGKMYPCIAIMEGGADILALGYAEAWEKTKAAAAQVVHGAECVGCPYDKTCPKCPGFRLKDLHSGHCNPSVCELTRKLVAAGVKKLEQVEPLCD